MTGASVRAVYWTFRRELSTTLRAPIAYVVGGLFLAVQGIAFAGLVGELSDPRKPAPLGALLEGQLAGTLLTWVLQLVVITLLGMRAVAEDKRGGAWELLLTARVGEGAAIVGKWLAASVVYALSWIPTLAYFAVVAWFRADDGGWDVAAIACGYAGAMAFGAALLAWAIAASAATTSTLAAGALGFAWLVGLFLVGELGSVWPNLVVDHPAVAHVLAAVSLRGQLATFARGELALPSITWLVALAATGLSLAITLACLGRRRAREVSLRAASTILVAIVGALAVVLAWRHPAQLDLSAGRRNSLAQDTRTVLAELPARASLTIIEPTLGALEPIYDEVAHVADGMADVAAIDVRRVDPAALAGGIDAAARLAGLAKTDLATNGGVVVRVGDRTRVIDLLALAEIDRGAGGAPAVEQLAIERALAGAFAALSDSSPMRVCATRGHGELSLLAHADKDADWTTVAARLRGDGATIEEVDLASAVPASCDVVIVAGPTVPLSASEALAIQGFVQRGGGVLVAAASRPVLGGRLAATGLEGELAALGVGLPAAIAIDPTLAVRELPGALLVIDGYAAHEINAGFARTRATLWFQPRAVLAERGASPLIHATAASWGERDLEHAPPVKDGDDLAGPVALAVLAAPPARVIALGSAESFASSLLAGGASAGDLWILRAVRWLVGRPERTLAIAGKSPQEVRLVMTAGQRRAVVALCTAGIPLAWLVLGGAFVIWRRRKAR